MYVEENTQFQLKVVRKSGLDVDGTYLPPAIHPSIAEEPKTDMKTAMLEAEMVMCGAVGDLLEKTGIKPEQIDILISNCSIFCPTPSLASMLINKFKLRRDIEAYHLGGMGCSIGVVAVGLVRDMLKAHPNSIALFVPAEITTYCFYPGRHKDFLVANAIFRMGGAAMLMTNKPSLYSRCKYELQYAERVHTGQDDTSYKCISWGPDEDGVNGVFLGKDVPQEAGKMLQAIMTWGQYAEAAYWMFGKRVLGYDWGRYAPDYTKCMDHFALHAGGYAVLKGIQKGMNLPMEMMLPSFASLRDMGNTSSSTTWYSMAYMERFGMVKQGQRVMQVGAGGGMKGGVNVWRALRDTQDLHRAWMHADRPYAEEDLPRRIGAEEEREARGAPAGGHRAKGEPEVVAADQEAIRLNGRAARVNGAVSNGKHKNAIQRAVEIEANIEADELGVVAL
ncbi:MAG: FAE1/Type III polyketide synthase-like protein-domain-containing protein [Monoraphidium minutum]|nr:MAG: FAE1/Type III polyketide synthase-like protein-domain-containing protein [Monoraphidium minutum]